VETPAAARDFLTVLTIAYGIDGVGPELAAGIFFDPRCLLEPDVLAVLAVVDGEPVATTMATLVDGTVGLYWTATVPQARGGGVAQACFTTVANTGFERGADLATLQASAMGEPLWRRLGFREVRRYRRYLAKPPA
jgi:GNAT superfamily N-acetyltransferase